MSGRLQAFRHWWKEESIEDSQDAFHAASGAVAASPAKLRAGPCELTDFDRGDFGPTMIAMLPHGHSVNGAVPKPAQA